MKRILILLTFATLHAGETKPVFKMVDTATHGEITVERHRAAEGSEQIWLASTADPTKRHFLYDIRTQTFSTNLDALNHKNTKL